MVWNHSAMTASLSIGWPIDWASGQNWLVLSMVNVNISMRASQQQIISMRCMDWASRGWRISWKLDSCSEMDSIKRAICSSLWCQCDVRERMFRLRYVRPRMDISESVLTGRMCQQIVATSKLGRATHSRAEWPIQDQVQCCMCLVLIGWIWLILVDVPHHHCHGISHSLHLSLSLSSEVSTICLRTTMRDIWPISRWVISHSFRSWISETRLLRTSMLSIAQD